MKVIIYAMSLVAAVVLMTMVWTPLAHAYPAPQEDPVSAPIELDPPVLQPAVGSDGLLDTDSDGIQDRDGNGVRLDNCPTVPNGYCNVDDAADCDIDGDGEITNWEWAAGYQKDWDGNGIGNACDDIDEDDVTDYLDVCPSVYNPADEDGIQDPQACSDFDGDGFSDDVDNCPENYNNTQEDGDEDGVGDTCDNCRFVANTDQDDEDDDGFGDACVGDADADGVADNVDNCPTVFNPDQANGDQDLRGDACDEMEAQATESGDGLDEAELDLSEGCTMVAGAQASAGVGFMSLLLCLAPLAVALNWRRQRQNKA